MRVSQSNFSYIYFVPYRKEAAVEVDGHFLTRMVYDDMKTYDLVTAAVNVLGNVYLMPILNHHAVGRPSCAVHTPTKFLFVKGFGYLFKMSIDLH